MTSDEIGRDVWETIPFVTSARRIGVRGDESDTNILARVGVSGNRKRHWLRGRLLGAVLVTVIVVAIQSGAGDASTPTGASAPGWSASEGPLPSDAAAIDDMYLSSVSCLSAGSCTAVGDYRDKSSNTQGLIERLTKGTWSLTEAPVPSNAAANPRVSFTSIACPSTGSCTAVGQYYDGSGNTQGLVESLSKGAWIALDAPLPENANTSSTSALSSVECPSDHLCDAVGSYSDMSGDDQGLIDTFKGATSSATEAPLPKTAGATSADLISIECISTVVCTAVGSLTDSSGNGQGLIDTLSAGTWNATEAPLPSNAGASPSAILFSVACASVDSCTAIGDYVDTSDSFQGLIETWSGGTWEAVEAPVPSGAGTDDGEVRLSSVTCPSTLSCTVVGTYDNGTSASVGLIDTLSGGDWEAIAPPVPSNANEGSQDVPLSSVTCTSARNCVAVGTYVDEASITQGLIDTLSGSSWRATEAPPASTGENDDVSSFGPVTCGSKRACVVLVDHAYSQGLIDTLSRGIWSSTEAMAPNNAQSIEASLNSVACPSAGACTVAGTYDDTSGTTQELIGTESGGSWSAIDAPLPSGAPGITVPSFGPVACASATVCDIAGVATIEPYTEPFVDTLSGGTWTSGFAPGPSGSDERTEYVSDVACGPPSTCVVVGSYGNFALHIASGFIDGSTASLPSNTTMYSSSGLSSASCAGSGSCIAVGGYEDASGDEQGLIDAVSGGNLTGTEAPVPTNAGSNPQAGLASVACASAGSCTAVGSYEDTSGDTDGLLDTLANGTWSTSEAPVPANAATGDADVSLGPVACGSASSCAALGDYKDTLGNQDELIETLSKGSWTGTEVPQPDDGSTLAALSSVACSSAGICYAVGTDRASSGGSEGLVETLSKGMWVATEAVLPANAGSDPEGSLSSVSCMSGGGCTAVGGYVDATGTTEGLIDSIS
jgi:hypothetical protein